MIGLTPDIAEARVVSHGILALTFADGLEGEVVVLERMRGPAFDRVRTPEGFAKVRVDGDTGARPGRAARTSPPMGKVAGLDCGDADAERWCTIGSGRPFGTPQTVFVLRRDRLREVRILLTFS